MPTSTQTEDIRHALRMVSFLLQYPTQTWRRDFSAWREAVDEIQQPQIRAVLADFFAYVQDLQAEAYEEQYVQAFDFSQNTNLYLTAHDCTDPGKQAEELVQYQAFYIENGFLPEKELPDYLPALLELASTLPPAKALRLLRFADAKLKLLRERLIDGKLAHAFLLDVVLMAENFWEEESP